MTLTTYAREGLPAFSFVFLTSAALRTQPAGQDLWTAAALLSGGVVLISVLALLIDRRNARRLRRLTAEQNN